VWVDRSEPVEVPLPSTAEGFPLVPTDISGVPNTSPTESPGVGLHYVKRGLRALLSRERLPSDLSTSILHELLFKIKHDSGSLVSSAENPNVLLLSPAPKRNASFILMAEARGFQTWYWVNRANSRTEVRRE